MPDYSVTLRLPDGAQIPAIAGPFADMLVTRAGEEEVSGRSGADLEAALLDWCQSLRGGAVDDLQIQGASIVVDFYADPSLPRSFKSEGVTFDAIHRTGGLIQWEATDPDRLGPVTFWRPASASEASISRFLESLP